MTDLREKKRVAFFRGHSAERFAAMVLLLKGFRIVARRYRTRLGEIDLIARRGNLVLIVEVKARSSLEAAQLAVTPQAMRNPVNEPGPSPNAIASKAATFIPWRASSASTIASNRSECDCTTWASLPSTAPSCHRATEQYSVEVSRARIFKRLRRTRRRK